jgi:anti-sigma-K factor RskA
MSASLLTDRSAIPSSGSTTPVETDYLAPVVPIRRSAPGVPDRRTRRPAPNVSRRAGSRGPRYVRGDASADWRLSRRGELLLRRVTVVVAAVVVILVVSAAAFAAARAVNPSPAPTRVVTVQSGQSLWQVAAAVSSSADVSDTADEIRSLNHLGGTTLTPGQVLLVPVTH